MTNSAMESVGKHYNWFIGLSAVILAIVALAAFPPLSAAQTAYVLTKQEKQVASNFEKQAREYAQLRERLERELPKLPKKATPEQIEAHKVALQTSVQNARTGAKQGDIFMPPASQLIKAIAKAEMKGRERVELRKTVLEAETKGVPYKVNAVYPEDKELVEMPPSLLLALPKLPKQLRYRFVARNLLLVDRENGLIVDYMTNALP